MKSQGSAGRIRKYYVTLLCLQNIPYKYEQHKQMGYSKIVNGAGIWYRGENITSGTCITVSARGRSQELLLMWTLPGSKWWLQWLVPTAHGGNPDWVLSSLLCAGPAPAMGGMWGVNQHIGNWSLSFINVLKNESCIQCKHQSKQLLH